MNLIPDFIRRIVIGTLKGSEVDTYMECLVYTHDFDRLILSVGLDPLKLKGLALGLMCRGGLELDYSEAEDEIIQMWEEIIEREKV